VVRSGVIVRGSIFIEDGRICWAAAHGLARRLTQLLQKPSNIDTETMESYFRLCQVENVPLGELLVSRGVVEPEDLRAALLQHTIESLALLCGGDTSTTSPATATFRPRPRKYNPRFTFNTTELLARSFAHSIAYRADFHPLLEAFDETGGNGGNEWAAVFARVPSISHPMPVALRGALPEKTAAVLSAGKWAASALDLTSTFQSEDALVSTTLGGVALVAWRHRDLIIAGKMPALGPARLLNRRARLLRR